MKNPERWRKALLWAHLLVCTVWLYLFRVQHEPPSWTVHVLLLSILGIQFTWGFTVGLIVGPGRKRRGQLWWSLLTVFMPLWWYGQIVSLIAVMQGLLIAMIYLAVFVAILASETYCGLVLGAQAHSKIAAD